MTIPLIIYISYFTLGNEVLTTKNATERFHSFGVRRLEKHSILMIL